jgi:hypothetical protein
MPNHITLTRAMCYAIGMDAGNAHMRANRRTHWTREEWTIASKTTNELLDRIEWRQHASKNDNIPGINSVLGA